MGVLDQYINTPEIQQAQQGADAAFSQVKEYGASMGGLPEKLRQAVLEKFNYNKDLIEQRNKAAADYFATPSAARVKYGDIGNPMMTEKLVAQDKAIMYQPWTNMNDLLSQRMGTIDRTANSLYDTAQSEYEMTKFGYEAARQKLQDLMTLGELKAKYDIAEKDKGDKGKSTAEKERDRIKVMQWFESGAPYGEDGLPGQEGMSKPNSRQEAVVLGQKLMSIGYDPGVVNEVLDAYYPHEAPQTGLEGKIGDVITNKLEGSKEAASSSTLSGTGPKLKDPTTGQIYQYDSYTDPEYTTDLNSGYQLYF